jgi:hypothetical protein
MRTVTFTYRALVADEDFNREQLDAMSMAAFVQIQEPEEGPPPVSVKAEDLHFLAALSEDAEVEELGGWFEEFRPAFHAKLFGAMVRRSRLVTEHYHSDLFHDAGWMQKYVTGEMSFYWAPRTFGSNIGTEPSLVGYGFTERDTTMHFYRVDVHQKVRNGKATGMWYATFTRCDPADCEDLTPEESK